MRRSLTALVVTLPFCLVACSSYAVHLYTDPNQLQVIEESLVLTEAETDDGAPIAVLMRGDTVVVIGERRNNWEYEQDMHDRFFIVYYGRRRAYVPYRSLVSRTQYASMYGSGRQPAQPARPATTEITPGNVASNDSASAKSPALDGDLTGGTPRDRRRNP